MASSSRTVGRSRHGARDLAKPQIESVREGTAAMMAQAGSSCGSWIVSTPEIAVRSARAWSTSAAAEGDAANERIANRSATETPVLFSADPGILDEVLETFAANDWIRAAAPSCRGALHRQSMGALTSGAGVPSRSLRFRDRLTALSGPRLSVTYRATRSTGRFLPPKRSRACEMARRCPAAARMCESCSLACDPGAPSREGADERAVHGSR